MLVLPQQLAVPYCTKFDLHLSSQAFDEHLNMVLGDVEEVHTTVEIDAETGEQLVKQSKRQIPMLYVRGDMVIIVSPPTR